MSSKKWLFWAPLGRSRAVELRRVQFPSVLPSFPNRATEVSYTLVESRYIVAMSSPCSEFPPLGQFSVQISPEMVQTHIGGGAKFITVEPLAKKLACHICEAGPQGKPKVLLFIFWHGLTIEIISRMSPMLKRDTHTKYSYHTLPTANRTHYV